MIPINFFIYIPVAKNLSPSYKEKRRHSIVITRTAVFAFLSLPLKLLHEFFGRVSQKLFLYEGTNYMLRG